MSKKIEKAICDVLEGAAQKRALSFVDYLKANQIILGESDTYWEVIYQDQCVCCIWVDGADALPGPWTIWSDQQSGSWASWSDGEGECRQALPIDDRIKEIAWANVNYCGSCGGDCSPGRTKTVLGRDFDHLCNSTMAFTDPDDEALDCAKKMIEFRIQDIRSNH